MRTTRYIGILAFLIALAGGSACDRTSPANTEVNNQPKTRAEEDLAEFRDWIEGKTSKADGDTANAKWSDIKEEFKQKTAKLDTRLDSLSAESKEEYKELRRKYETWEANNQKRTSTPLSQDTLKRFNQELLGSANALAAHLTAEQMRDVYTQFVQNVRMRRDSWTASDWDYVDEIYSQLNKKKDQVEDQIPAKDKLKIKALQAEYLALETGKDAKDLYKGVK
ncbi:DUF6565 domain-containing protein [Sabulibacter ruber]|uniref:DUF6565 domain-containing protein n=1 Tax=Sabulibacter ruber TaxID=2811901 RepID=UPI001A9770C3|nr:DUF6565 domain-containing protein [Sabulibacter ruber]